MHMSLASLSRPASQFAGAVGYAAFSELLFSPKEYQVGGVRLCSAQPLVPLAPYFAWLPHPLLAVLQPHPGSHQG